jgi:hypothetical protein
MEASSRLLFEIQETLMSRKQDHVSIVRKTPSLSRTHKQESGRTETAMPARAPAPQVVLRRAQDHLSRLRPAEIRMLQRSAGNRLVQRIGLKREEHPAESALAATAWQAGRTSHAGAAPADAAVQRMSVEERNGLNPDDYGDARFNRTLRSGYRLFTIWHNTDPKLNIQVHWHPISDNFPQEAWTVRWATEGGGNKPALEWMKERIRATPQGTMVALASMQQGGAEYEEQFPALGEATGAKKK